MIRFRLKELLADMAFREGRRITLEEVGEATGIARATLSRISNVKGYNTTTENIDKLCKFFGVGIGDVAEYVSEEPGE